MVYCEDSSDDSDHSDSDKEKYIAQINHTAREGRVVVLEQSPIEDETSERAAYEADDLAFAEGRAQQTYRHECT